MFFHGWESLGLTPVAGIRPRDAAAVDVLSKATRKNVGRLAVLENSRLVGDLSLKDSTHVLALKGGLAEGQGRSAPGAVGEHGRTPAGSLMPS